MTKKYTTPVPLIFHSAEHMRALSNKHESVKSIFNHMNYSKLDRIDAFELMSMILLSIDGSFDQFIKNIIFVYGFSDMQNQVTITQEEFHFFLDCMFRSIMTLSIAPEYIENPTM